MDIYKHSNYRYISSIMEDKTRECSGALARHIGLN